MANATQLADRAQARAALDPRVQLMLDLERHWWKFDSDKEAAVRSQLGISLVDFQRSINQLLDDPAVLAADPVLVRRLQRQRATRVSRPGRGPRSRSY